MTSWNRPQAGELGFLPHISSDAYSPGVAKVRPYLDFPSRWGQFWTADLHLDTRSEQVIVS